MRRTVFRFPPCDAFLLQIKLSTSENITMARIANQMAGIIAGLSVSAAESLKKPVKAKLESLGLKAGKPYDLNGVVPIAAINVRAILAFVDSVEVAPKDASDNVNSRCDENVAALQSLAASLGVDSGLDTEPKPEPKQEAAKTKKEPKAS